MSTRRIATLAAVLALAGALATAPAAAQPAVGPNTDLATVQTMAAAGDADAAFELGERYYFGEGLPVDPAEAVRWYRVAAEAGHPAAQNTPQALIDLLTLWAAGSPPTLDSSLYLPALKR